MPTTTLIRQATTAATAALLALTAAGAARLAAQQTRPAEDGSTAAAHAPAGATRAAPPAGPSALPPDSVIQRLLDARVKLLSGAGIVAGVVDANGARFLSAGTLDGPGTPAPDAGTVFEIGSVTKTFTATLLADMVRRGEVRLDQPVAALLPDSVRVPQKDGRAITLLDLATQSSGLPRLPTNLRPADVEDPYGGYTVADLYRFLDGYTLPRDPGAQYEYSNLGVGLLGLALARRADTSYEALVRARIAGPLGMKDTRITLTSGERARLAPGHNAAGDTVANWDMATLAAAGGLRSTAHDMLRYLEAALAADTMAPVARDLAMARLPRRPTPVPATRIGLVWMVRDGDDGVRVVWHNGETGGYHAFVGYQPGRRVGVIMLSNSATGADDIGLHLLDATIPLVPPPPPARHTVVQLTPTQLDAYVGRYQLAPGVALTIARADDRLSAQITGQGALPIFAEGGDRFFYKVVDATLEFRRDASGAVTSLVLHQNGRDIEGQRTP